MRFQHYLLDNWMTKSLNQLFAANMANNLGGVVLSERCPFTSSRVFVAQLVEQKKVWDLDGALLYKKSVDFFQAMLNIFRLKPVFVHLRDCPFRAHSRMKKRGRPGEEHLTVDDLGDLALRYDAVFTSMKVDYPFFRIIDVNLCDFLLNDQGDIDIAKIIEFICASIFG